MHHTLARECQLSPFPFTIHYTLYTTTAKWWGGCNDVKANMDECFRQEKERKRSANLKKAREFDAKFEEITKRKAAAAGAAAAASSA